MLFTYQILFDVIRKLEATCSNYLYQLVLIWSMYHI